MIQDIAPHRFQNAFLPGQKISQADPVVVFRGSDVLVHIEEESFSLPLRRDFPAAEEDAFIFLFQIDETRYFTCPEEVTVLPDGFSFLPMRSLRRTGKIEKHLVFAVYTGHQLCSWYEDNRFCGRCGTRTVLAEDERAIDCPSCKRRIYPRIVPAVIVGVTDHDRLLITRYANRLNAVDALVAGFTEIGETLEETVAREVMEEVGLKVTNIRYYKSQPWAIADDILAGFYCDAVGDTTIRLDRTELKEGRWVERADIVGQPDDFSLTNEMMMVFRDGKEPKGTAL